MSASRISTFQLCCVIVSSLGVTFSCKAQFQEIQVEQVPNDGIVPGSTYRIYAVMQNEGDYIDAVYGEEKTPLSVSSTAPFYQNQRGGATSKDTQRWDYYEEMNPNADPALRFDSWVTIGFEDNYENDVRFTDQAAASRFESGNALTTNDGAWWSLPRLDADNRIIQSGPTFAGTNKRILLMQLTTTGTVQGLININGKEAPKKNDEGQMFREVIRETGIKFVCTPVF